MPQEQGTSHWWPTFGVMLGGLTVALNSGVLNVAIPSMMSSLSTDLDRIQWVQTGLPDHPGGHDTRRRMAGGTAGDEALVHPLHAPLHHRLGALWAGLGRALADHLPHPPRHRGWPHHAAQHEYSVQHLPPRQTRPRPGPVEFQPFLRAGDRAGARRLSHRGPQLAGDFLHQCAGRTAERRHRPLHHAENPGSARQPLRCPGGVHHGELSHPAPARRQRRPAVWLGLADDPHAVRRVRRCRWWSLSSPS